MEPVVRRKSLSQSVVPMQHSERVSGILKKRAWHKYPSLLSPTLVQILLMVLRTLPTAQSQVASDLTVTMSCTPAMVALPSEQSFAELVQSVGLQVLSPFSNGDSIESGLEVSFRIDVETAIQAAWQLSRARSRPTKTA